LRLLVPTPVRGLSLPLGLMPKRLELLLLSPKTQASLATVMKCLSGDQDVTTLS
jgi:hypothetical protein